jgi:hypothetical protein
MNICPRCNSIESKRWYGIPEESNKVCYPCYRKRERIKYNEKISEYRKKYYLKNREWVSKKSKEYARTKSGKYSILLSRSKLKHTTINILSREDHDRLINSKCHYCPNTHNLGIDRADNSKGYEPDNCRPCCSRCNYIKRDILTEDEMLYLMRMYLSGEQPHRISYPLSYPPLGRDRSGSRYWKLKRGASARGILLNIEHDKYNTIILENDNMCHYCTAILSSHGYALDRKDHTIGYTEDNVVTCCSFCNAFKLNYLTYDETKVMVAILQHYHKQMGTVPNYSPNHK